MKKKLEVLKKSFSKPYRPNVPEYNATLRRMSSLERANFSIATFQLATGYWDRLLPVYQRFMVKLIRHNPQAYVNYRRLYTVEGRLQYKLRNPQLMIPLFRLLEGTGPGRATFYNRLALALCAGFDFSIKVDTLANNIRTAPLPADRLLFFMGMLPIEDVE